jgi:hypothetical protein
VSSQYVFIKNNEYRLNYFTVFFTKQSPEQYLIRIRLKHKLILDAFVLLKLAVNTTACELMLRNLYFLHKNNLSAIQSVNLSMLSLNSLMM